MMNMEHKYSAKDICDIIKACDKSNVKELKLSDLHVSFEPDSKKTHDLGELGLVPEGTQAVSDQHVQPAPQAPQLTTDEQEEFLHMAQINQELIEDPLSHEQAVIDDFLRSKPTPEELALVADA
jgi:hypothetical protein